MENETQEQENVQAGQKSVLHQVTPLSKYLALALFVILPFLGGWIGYMYAPEKVVEVERLILKEVEVEVPVFNDGVVLEGNLLKDFDIVSLVDDKYKISWMILDDVHKLFSELDTAYITFSLVPVGGAIDYKNNNGVSQNIGDGFTFDKSSHTFSPKYYDETFSWSLDWGAAYQIVGRVTYQPSEFGCNPLYPKDCSPVYSSEDGQLVQLAEKYIFVSEPFILE